MPAVNLTDILRIFYSTGASAIPVIQAESSSYPVKKLLGFIRRKDLDREFSDIKRTSKSPEKLPEHLIKQIGELSQFREYFEKNKLIPVINSNGKSEPGWTETELLIALSGSLSENNKQEFSEDEQEALPLKKIDETSQSADLWLARLMLSGISHPLFAAGLKGETLFYNQTFEKLILNLPFFNNSISNLELFFLELTRDFLARNAMRGLSTEKVTAAPVQIPFIIDITALEDNNTIIGYLYLFRNSEQIIEEISTLAADSKDYKYILEGIESSIILKTLEKNQFNISHAAIDLKIKRSTLQNRIKLLNLEKTITEEKNRAKKSPHNDVTPERIPVTASKRGTEKHQTGTGTKPIRSQKNKAAVKKRQNKKKL